MLTIIPQVSTVNPHFADKEAKAQGDQTLVQNPKAGF